MQTTETNTFGKYQDLTEQELDRLYLDHYPALNRYAFTIVNDRVIAEEMVQQVFFKLLERPASVTIHTSMKAYLYRSVNNECLNYIKHCVWVTK